MATLDNSLARKFAKAAAGGEAKKERTESRATARVVDGKVYAQLDGSTVTTPVETTVTVNDGDELLVSIRDHKAMVVGNITSNAIDKQTFYRLLEDGSLNIAVNNLDIAADGTVTVGAGADFNVMAGGQVNLNDRLVLTEDGKLTLKIDSMSIGGSEDIDDLDDLKGEPGEPGRDGEDGVDVTSQYVTYTQSGTYAGLNLVSDEGLGGYHANIRNDSFNIMDGTDTVAKFEGGAITLLGSLKMTAIVLSLFGQRSQGLALNADFACNRISTSGVIQGRDGRFTADVEADAYNVSSPGHTGGGVFTADVGVMTGSGGSNHGLWSSSQGKWMIYSNGSTITCNSGSSKFIKENIEDVTDTEAAKLLGVRTVTYDYKGANPGNKGWIGVLAEEVYPVIPRAVIQPEEPYEDLAGMIERGENTEKLGIDYGTFTPYLIKLCQMQQRQIDDLTARVAALEAKQPTTA